MSASGFSLRARRMSLRDLASLSAVTQQVLMRYTSARPPKGTTRKPAAGQRGRELIRLVLIDLAAERRAGERRISPCVHPKTGR